MEWNYPVIDMKATGVWLRFLCRKRCISVLMVQEYLGLSSNQAIYAWFNGKALPSLDNFCALGGLLKISLDSMLVFSNREHPFLEKLNRVQKRIVVYWWKVSQQTKIEKLTNL